MASDIKVFEKAKDGWVETTREAARGRRYSRVTLVCDVLFTAEEEAQRIAEEKQNEETARLQALEVKTPLKKLQTFMAANPDVVDLIK